MENRSIWSFHGLTGYFIAVALLLGILVWLSAAAIITQNETAQQAYEVKDPFGIKMFGPDLENEKHIYVYGHPVGGDTKHKYHFIEKK